MRHWTKFWVVPLALVGLGMAVAMGPSTAALAQNSSDSESKSWTSSISSGFKKLGQTLTPKSKTPVVIPGPEDDAISLKDKEKKPGPALHVAWAHFHEQAKDWAEAEKQYLLALDLKSDYLPALLGYAQLKDQMGQPNEAIKQYQHALKLYPNQASIHNNVGLMLVKQKKLDQAIAAMTRTVELDSKNPLYRNNIAAMLVDKGQTRDAFVQLRAVHGEAEAYYNMGFLLNKKGQTQAALQHFMLALQNDPSMDAAKRWIEYLQATPQNRLAANTTSNGMKNIDQPKTPDKNSPNFQADSPNFRPSENGTVPLGSRKNPAMLPGVEVLPFDDTILHRLPPVKSSQTGAEGPYLPGISYGPTPTAPLPPPTSNSASLQKLPKVQ